MRLFKIFLMGIALASTPLVISACDENTTLEEGAEEVADEVDDATTE